MLIQYKPDINSLPGGWEDPNIWFSLNTTENVERISYGENCLVLKQLFTPNDCELLVTLMNQAPAVETVDGYGKRNEDNVTKGSQRTTIWSETLSQLIWQKLAGHLEERTMNDFTPTDWWQNGKHRKWMPYGVSPLLRFMNYDYGSIHLPHYDAGYIYEDTNYRTLMSFIIYLTTHPSHGATRFIRDGQENLPVWERRFEDWTRECTPEEILFPVYPEKGNMLLFDHRMCHDAEKYEGKEPRIIIRGDIIFKAL